jgi:hypothetical protein
MLTDTSSVTTGHVKQYLWLRAYLGLQLLIPIAIVAGSLYFLEKPRSVVLQHAISYSSIACLVVMALFITRLFLRSPYLAHFLRRPVLLVIAALRGGAIYSALLWGIGRFGDQVYLWVFQHPVQAVGMLLAAVVAFLAGKAAQFI